MSLPRPSCRWLPLVLVSPLAAQEGAPGSARLVFESLAGEESLVDPQGLSLTDPRERDAWLVRPRGYPAPPAGTRSGEVVRIELSGGDALLGRIAGGEGEQLWLELIGGVRLPVDVSAMRRIVLPERLPPGRLVSFEAPSEGDRLYRRTGGELDRIDGTLEAFEAGGVRFESVLGSRSFPWSEVAGLVVEVLGEGRAVHQGSTPVVVDLVDGSRLRGQLLALEEAACRIAVAGSELELAWRTVVEITVDDGALVFLSEVRASAEEGKGAPFGDDVGMVWEHRIDREVTGAPLTVGGRIWRRGIGSHAPTRITWQLGGAFSHLRGAVGIDDSSQWNPEDARGAVVFRVWCDGQVAWESGLVRGGDGVVHLPSIDVAGTTELVLEADMAGDFRGDRANWIRMLLVR